jgi:hypothetical protein
MEIETEVALLKSDVHRMTSLFEKLDTAIEKMGDVSNSIARMLAVHEERLNKHDLVEEELFTLVEKRKQELQGDVKDLHSRISTVSRDLSNDLGDTEHRIMTALTTGMNDLKRCITDETKAVNSQHKDLETRVNELEKWRWTIMGGSIVIGAFAHEIIGVFLK